MVNFGDFLKTWSLKSNSVTRQVTFKTTKISEKRQNSNATFWVKFKHCVIIGKRDFHLQYWTVELTSKSAKESRKVIDASGGGGSFVLNMSDFLMMMHFRWSTSDFLQHSAIRMVRFVQWLFQARTNSARFAWRWNWQLFEVDFGRSVSHGVLELIIPGPHLRLSFFRGHFINCYGSMLFFEVF